MLSDKSYKNELEKQLQQLGLSAVQSKIYLSILNSKKTTVLQIARDIGLQRPTIYDNLPILESSQLIGTIIEGKKKYLIPQPPENLSVMLQQKQSAAKELIPSLIELFNQVKPSEPNVRFYRGKDGLEKLADIILTSKEKEIWTLADYERNIHEPFSEKYLRTLWETRNKKHIFGKILYTHASLPALTKSKDYSEIGNIRYNREVRILPKSIKLSVLYTIVDNNVLFWGTKEEETAFQFISESYATSLKSLFSYLWSVSDRLHEMNKI